MKKALKIGFGIMFGLTFVMVIAGGALPKSQQPARVVTEAELQATFTDLQYRRCARKGEELEMKKYMYDATCKREAALAWDIAKAQGYVAKQLADNAKGK